MTGYSSYISRGTHINGHIQYGAIEQCDARQGGLADCRCAALRLALGRSFRLSGRGWFNFRRHRVSSVCVCVAQLRGNSLLDALRVGVVRCG